MLNNNKQVLEKSIRQVAKAWSLSIQWRRKW